MKNLLLILAVLFNLSATGSGEKQPARYVSFCEVVRHPEKYDQQMVLTAGVIEHGLFFDPACKPQPNPDPTLPADLTLSALENKHERGSPGKRLDDLLETDKRAFVVVEARFDAYRRYSGPLPKDERLQELLKKGNARFGHDNCCRFRLAIQQVKLAEPTVEEFNLESSIQLPAEGPPETVDLKNGNLHLQIPIVASKPKQQTITHEAGHAASSK